MSSKTINEAILKVISALQGCVSEDPNIERILNNIDNDFSKIERVIFHGTLPTNVLNNITFLFETLDKVSIILSYIESFRTYVSVYRKDDIKSINLCMKELDEQYQTITTNLEEIKRQVKT
jgi:hypothetical protein